MLVVVMDGGRGASSVQTKVRVGGTSREGSAARCSPGGVLERFWGVSRRPRDETRRSAHSLSSSAGSRAQIKRVVGSETRWPGVVMKGNNEGEEGGISIASRKTLAASTGLGVLPAQAGAVSVDQENRRGPWKNERVLSDGASCMSLASRRDEAGTGAGGGVGPRGETCTTTRKRARRGGGLAVQ